MKSPKVVGVQDGRSNRFQKSQASRIVLKMVFKMVIMHYVFKSVLIIFIYVTGQVHFCCTPTFEPVYSDVSVFFGLNDPLTLFIVLYCFLNCFLKVTRSKKTFCEPFKHAVSKSLKSF